MIYLPVNKYSSCDGPKSDGWTRTGQNYSRYQDTHLEEENIAAGRDKEERKYCHFLKPVDTSVRIIFQ